jgi:Tol biopolymer transport system component
MVGTQLGHYRIERLLGSGGMGEVYVADDLRLGRRVALKILSTELAGDTSRRERFEREARAAATLNHPNIVTIHSVEEAGGVPFLTLELLDGKTLGEIIPAGGLPLDRLLTLAIPLADAVGAAHQAGITHRDLKPANVMVTSDGRVKVLDFGLAKLREEARANAETTLPTAALTGEGRIVGTVMYMSPEQAEGKPVDQRSDVFSLGIILYEMATGVRPFSGDTQLSILSSIMKDTPRPITEAREGIPRELSKIVNRCLAKDPEDRYQSAKDLRNDLRALKNELTSGEIVPVTSGSGVTAAAPAAKKGSRTPMLAVAGIVVVAAIVGGVMWSQRATGPVQTEPRPFDSINLTRLTTTGTAGIAALSRDGRYVAHVSIRDGKASLWLRQVATTSNVEIVPPAEVNYRGVSFSPDGDHIYYAAYPRGANLGNLYRVPVLGGGARLIAEDVDTAATFSPDGSQLAFLRGAPDQGESYVIVAGADGTNQRKLAVRKRPLNFTLLSVAWSPDGKAIAATGSNESQLSGQVVIVDVASGTERVLATPQWRLIGGVAWLADGSGLLVNAQESAGETSSQIFLAPYPSGTPRRLTNDLSTYAGVSVAPDGRSFVTVRNERRATIWTMPLDDASKAVAVTTEASADDGAHGIAWMPDGRIVYTTEAGGNPDIWIMRADGSGRVQLTSTSGQDVSPKVTSDGKYIVFASDRDGGIRAWRMAPDGSGATRISQDIVARARAYPSADGKWVYYSEQSGDIRRAPIEGGAGEKAISDDLLKRLSASMPPEFHEPMLSPDGTLLAGHYLDDASRGERVALVPIAGGEVRLLNTVPPSATWMPDGKSLVYAATRGGVSNLMRQPIAGGPAVPVTKFTSEQIFGYAVSPDQKQVAIVRGRVSSDVVLVSSGK